MRRWRSCSRSSPSLSRATRGTCAASARSPHSSRRNTCPLSERIAWLPTAAHDLQRFLGVRQVLFGGPGGVAGAHRRGETDLRRTGTDEPAQATFQLVVVCSVAGPV